MSLPLRPRVVSQCPACLRSYAFALFSDGQTSALPSSLRQQIRGKKRMPNNSATVTVKLLKDVEAYGKSGSFVPITRGAMRNSWYPSRIAEYVTMPELQKLRLNNVPMERNFEFITPEALQQRNRRKRRNMSEEDIEHDLSQAPEQSADASSTPRRFAAARAPEIEKITPQRSLELVENFVPHRLEFHRQPAPEKPKPKKPMPQFRGAAGDLMASRLHSEDGRLRAIFGSVTPQDVLAAVREGMARNDEAARVVLLESEIAFVDLPDVLGAEAGRVKHMGDFTVEIRARGAEGAVRRVVRVLPQEERKEEMVVEEVE